jgi:hypothetical protein
MHILFMHSSKAHKCGMTWGYRMKVHYKTNDSSGVDY